jgi:hypothetical protein
MSTSNRRTGKTRRAIQKQRNIYKNIEAKNRAVNKGRIIKEEHGQELYSAGFCANSAKKLYELIIKKGDPETSITTKQRIQKYRKQILNLLVYWARYIEDLNVSSLTNRSLIDYGECREQYKSLCRLMEIYYGVELHKK